jgi:hypothetical protein
MCACACACVCDWDSVKLGYWTTMYRLLCAWSVVHGGPGRNRTTRLIYAIHLSSNGHAAAVDGDKVFLDFRHVWTTWVFERDFQRNPDISIWTTWHFFLFLSLLGLFVSSFCYRSKWRMGFSCELAIFTIRCAPTTYPTAQFAPRFVWANPLLHTI